jgi:hypothetical protein
MDTAIAGYWMPAGVYPGESRSRHDKKQKGIAG